MNLWLAVFIGGGAGSVVRYAVSRALQALVPATAFPWATFMSNLLATTILAWLVARGRLFGPEAEHWRALLAIGFCGGFSTMSTFNMENYQLLRDGFYGFAALNIVLSLTLGSIAFHFFARTTW